MCEFSAKLVAWLDGELSADEALEMEQRVRSCAECTDRLNAYKGISSLLGAYCEAKLAAGKPRRPMSHWASVVGAGASLALLWVLFLHVRPQPGHPHMSMPAAAAAPTTNLAKAANPQVAHEALRRRASARPRIVAARVRKAAPSANWAPAEPAIEIAIPGEAMFPPGALPPGIDFIADVSLGADGSTQRVGLRPQLTEFERGPSR